MQKALLISEKDSTSTSSWDFLMVANFILLKLMICFPLLKMLPLKFHCEFSFRFTIQGILKKFMGNVNYEKKMQEFKTLCCTKTFNSKCHKLFDISLYSPF